MLATTLAAVLAESSINISQIVLGMIVGGGVGALIGNAKNRIMLGTLLGVFLGCIGWIIMAFIPKKPSGY